MGRAEDIEQGSLVVRLRAGAGDRAYWDAQWRYRFGGEPWRLKKRRLGLAWQEQGADGKWHKRHGRRPDDWLDERAANVAAVAAMDEHAAEVELAEKLRREKAEHKATVRELAGEWLEWLDEVRGAKPSTIQDYRYLLREPGERYRRGSRSTAGRIMSVFGDRPAEEITTAEVSRFRPRS